MIKIILSLTFLYLLNSCNPEGMPVECQPGQEFRAASRSCVAISQEQNTDSENSTNNLPQLGPAQAFSLNEDTFLGFNVNPATDADDDILSYVIVSAPANGTITNCMDAVGSTGLNDLFCTYTPNPNFFGTDSFTYRATDGKDFSATHQTITFTVNNVDDAPLAIMSAIDIFEDTPLTFSLSYQDPDGDLATHCNVTNTINLDADGAGGAPVCSCIAGVCQVTLVNDVPKDNTANGTLFSFDYTITANGQTSPVQNVSVTVLSVNNAPEITTLLECTGGSTSVCSFDQDIAISASFAQTTPLHDDVDLEGDTAGWRFNSAHTCSFVSINSSTGQISGTPTNNDVGTCILGIEVFDSADATDSQNMTITINNVAPSFNSLTANITFLESSSNNIISITNATVGTGLITLPDTEYGYGTFSINTAASTCDDLGIGSVSINSTTGSISFTPEPIEAGVPYCTIVVNFNDGNSGIASSTITVNITPVDDPPVFITNTIPNQIGNEGTRIIVDTDLSTPGIQGIVIDEGGGSDEDADDILIQVSSSNTALIPLSASNILLLSGSDLSAIDSTPTIAAGVIEFDDPAPADNYSDLSLYLVVVPAPGQVGSSDITITAVDGGTNAASVSKTFTVTITNSSVSHQGWSKIYSVGAKINHQENISHQPAVEIAWNQYNVNNDNIAGYRVFRSENPNDPWIEALPDSLNLGSNDLLFRDESLDESDAGKIYYYKVMAVSSSNQQLMDTNANYATLKVIIPPHNMSLVNRRVANTDICTHLPNGLDQTIDLLNYSRCEYTGPGDVNIGGTNYYDTQTDLIIDSFEASCNFSQIGSGLCPETGQGCIGTSIDYDILSGDITGALDAIYYERDTAKCYYHNGANWKEITLLTMGGGSELEDFAAANHLSINANQLAGSIPSKPPLVHMTQEQAAQYCQFSQVNINSANFSKTLLDRKAQIAAASYNDINFDPDNGLNDSAINALETGANLSSALSQCNSSNGGQINFIDDINSSNLDLIPSTSGSAHKLLVSGSSLTSSCQSRYGIQDLVGNVAEWTSERFHIFNQATGEIRAINANYNQALRIDTNAKTLSFDDANTAQNYHFDGDNAPLNASLSSWLFKDKNFATDFFFRPLGLPALSSAVGDYSQIGVQITNAQLRGDGIEVNLNHFAQSVTDGTNNDTTVDNNELAGMIVGGSYQHGSQAGRYFFGLHPSSDSTGISITNPGTVESSAAIGFRCMVRIPY